MCSLIMASALFLPAGAKAEPQQELIVSAAMSLKNAFEEIGKLFESRCAGAKVSFNFGASGDLARQIEGGAPADVFASASPKDMDSLQNKGLILHETRDDFAGNEVVLIAPAASKLNLKKTEDLKIKGVKKIAIGNPQTVPAGRYAEEVLKHYRMFDALRDRLVLGENARQVLDYVARGEVDAGIVYRTDAMAQAQNVKVFVRFSEESHSPIVYPAAVIKDTKNGALAREFVRFLASSPEARRALETYGFLPSETKR